MQTNSNFDTLFSNIEDIKKDMIKEYVEYMSSSGLFGFLPNISSSDQIRLEELSVNPKGDILKIVVNDPAAFIASYAGSRGISSIFDQTQKIYLKHKMRELLFESIIVSHLKHIPIIQRGQLIHNIACILTEVEEKLIEPCDGLVWYVELDHKLKLTR